MLMKIAADAVVMVHFMFIAFVAFGGLLVWYRPGLAWLHLPALGWAIYVMVMGQTCPLTPLENWLLRQAGYSGYQDGFIEHYLLPIIYPENITRDAQMHLAVAAFTLNLLTYALFWYRRRPLRRR